jgi:hypothetical protein
MSRRQGENWRLGSLVNDGTGQGVFSNPVRHSERSEESKGTVVSQQRHAASLGFFAALRMTGL